MTLGLILGFGSPLGTQASSLKDTSKDAVNITLDDIKLEPGQADINQLPEELKEKVQDRIKVMDEYFLQLGELENKIANKKAELNNRINVSQNLNELNALQEEYKYIYNNSEIIAGITKVEIEATIDLQSAYTNVTVPKPTLYYDSDSKMYSLTGTWNWNTNYPDGSVGGLEGFGLRIEQEQITVFQHDLYTWDNMGASATRYHPSVSAQVNSRGIGMKWQDSWRNLSPATYSAFSGRGHIYFKFYNGTPYGKSLNTASVYAHTWSSTSLTSLSAGLTSFGFGWKNESHNWSRENYNVVSF
ncbi:hypothetical protein P5X88_23720 [Heyndrickxia oleronia]|uniref:Uncharacterized protein n=1 Tax=Heyndrickxia oleronia TaxID=38875 RepID=A0AAW6T3S3_9BACI|nr:hypothetical protein [Heyndrickxia oleronia]